MHVEHPGCQTVNLRHPGIAPGFSLGNTLAGWLTAVFWVTYSGCLSPKSLYVVKALRKCHSRNYTELLRVICCLCSWPTVAMRRPAAAWMTGVSGISCSGYIPDLI